MKVLHSLVSGNNGGIETLIRNYADYTKEENLYFFSFGGGINADLMRDRGHDVIICKYDKGRYFRILNRLVKVLKENKIEVIVEHHGSTLMRLLCCVRKLIIPNVKYVLYAHCHAEDMYTKNGKKNIILFCLDKYSYKHCDKIVAISKSVSDSLVRDFSINPNKIKIIYNGTDLVNCSEISQVTKNKDRLIFVGRLIENKGVQVILKGLAGLENTTNYYFTIVGDGPYRKTLEQFAINKGISEKVFFAGNCDDVPKRLSKAGVFIHMPLWEEGFGITVIEAMAEGLICICAKSGGIPEIITDGVNGFLIEKNDVNALIDKIRYVLNAATDDELRKISNNAKIRALDFSIENYTYEIDSLIENIS